MEQFETNGLFMHLAPTKHNILSASIFHLPVCFVHVSVCASVQLDRHSLLWIIFVIYVLCLSYFRVCSLLPCGHLWSPVRRGLTSWLLFMKFNCVFVTFPCDILGQPDRCGI